MSKIRQDYKDEVQKNIDQGMDRFRAANEAKVPITKLYGEYSEGTWKASVIDGLIEQGVNIGAYCDQKGIEHSKLDDDTKVKIFDALFKEPGMKEMGEALLNLQRVDSWMQNNELGANRYKDDMPETVVAFREFKEMRQSALSGVGSLMQEQLESLKPKRSLDKWQEHVPDSFKKIEGRAPSSKEVLAAMGLKKTSIAANPKLSEALGALDDFSKINTSTTAGRSQGLKALATAEHAIYDMINNSSSPTKAGVLIQTLALIQAEHQKLIGQILDASEDYPADLVRELAPGETIGDVQALWKDMVGGKKGFKVIDEVPAKTAEVGGGQVMVVKPAEKKEGFRTEAFSHLARLIATPGGRDIIRKVMEKGDEFPIQIQPRGGTSQAGQYHPSDAEATEGKGSAGHVEMPVGMRDIDYKAYDGKGSDLLFPGFVMIGHELGHAIHAQRGEAVTSDKAVLPVWVDKEEQITIESVENLLRKEHGLGERFGVKGDQFN